MDARYRLVSGASPPTPTPSPAPALVLEDGVLHHRAASGVVRALDGLHFEAPAGARTVLLGANGAGKSSALRLLAGMHPAAAGRVRVGGVEYDVGHNPPPAGQIGWVGSDPEDHLIAPKVDDEIAFGLLNLGVPPAEARARVAAVAERLGLVALLTRSVHALSHGERQRVVLAGVLVLEPAVLLLDEPTLGLDRPGRRALLALLDAEVARGTTVVAATHDDDLARHWADHVVVLVRGRAVRAGAPARVLADAAWCAAAGIT